MRRKGILIAVLVVVSCIIIVPAYAAQEDSVQPQLKEPAAQLQIDEQIKAVLPGGRTITGTRGYIQEEKSKTSATEIIHPYRPKISPSSPISLPEPLAGSSAGDANALGPQKPKIDLSFLLSGLAPVNEESEPILVEKP